MLIKMDTGMGAETGENDTVAAIVLAAGLSSRMGQPKMLLPWGATTVIGRVTSVLLQAGARPVVVVTGAAHAEVQAALGELPVQTCFNPRYAEDNMALSLQAGLLALPQTVQAALVALGDQPQIRLETVQEILDAFQHSAAPLIAPTWQGRRGHPWLAARSLWPGLLALQPPATLRDWMHTQAGRIMHLEASCDTILRDLDTPQDYGRERPRSSHPGGG